MNIWYEKCRNEARIIQCATLNFSFVCGLQIVRDTQTAIESMKGQATSASLSASVSTMFASGGVGASYEEESKSSSSNARSRRSRQVISVGEDVDPETETIPRSEDPAVLDVTFRPVCDLLPEQAMGLPLKSDCFEWFSSDAVCFSQLPRKPSFDPIELLEHFNQIKTVQNCNFAGIPMVHMKIDPNIVSGHINNFEVKSSVKTLWECFMKCAVSGRCAMASFDSAKCTFCKVNVHDAIPNHQVFQMKEDSNRNRRWCLENLKRPDLGIESSFQSTQPFPVDTNSELYCTINVPKYKQTDHCTKSLVPCKEGEGCSALARQMPQRPVVEGPGRFSPWSLGIPLFPSTLILADIVGWQNTQFLLRSRSELVKWCMVRDRHVDNLIPDPSDVEAIDKAIVVSAMKCLDDQVNETKKVDFDMLSVAVTFPETECTEFMKELKEVKEFVNSMFVDREASPYDQVVVRDYFKLQRAILLKEEKHVNEELQKEYSRNPTEQEAKAAVFSTHDWSSFSRQHATGAERDFEKVKMTAVCKFYRSEEIILEQTDDTTNCGEGQCRMKIGQLISVSSLGEIWGTSFQRVPKNPKPTPTPTSTPRRPGRINPHSFDRFERYGTYDEPGSEK